MKSFVQNFERFLFGFTRIVSIIGAIVVIIGIVLLLINFISFKDKTYLSYSDIKKEIQNADSKQPTVVRNFKMPANLEIPFTGNNAAILQTWLSEMPESEQQNFFDNLSEIVAKARKADVSREYEIKIFNTYHNVKLSKIKANEFNKYSELIEKGGYIAGIFGLILILSILSLILVTLAIERNTRGKEIKE